jgi:hypothetical protein
MSSGRRFDLNTFITDNYYSSERQFAYDTDIFDELQGPTSRFSFSIPEDIVPPPPPPSPDQTPRLTINIPKEKDDDTELDMLELESNPPTPTNIQPTLDFSKEALLISSIYDKKVYRRPPKKSIDARKVWRYAKISSIATIYEIEYKLLDWAFTYASLEIVDKKINLITWRSDSNCTCTCTWNAFLKWIICATHSV